MSVQKLFNNKNQIDSKVDVNIHENGDSVIIIDDQVDTTKQVCRYIYMQLLFFVSFLIINRHLMEQRTLIMHIVS
jgi:hypothetical protein